MMRRALLSAMLRRIRRDERGNALIEFALITPLFLMLGMYGIELAYMATVNMQVSQIAMSVADNASRVGQTDNSSVTPTVTNADVDSIMFGALQEGRNIDIEKHGRIILSSLEQSGTRQYIHWQKCRGDLVRSSSYGGAGTGLSGSELTGMGRAGAQVTADENNAVMFAEVYYDYQPLFGRMFVNGVRFRHEAALLVRDDRNLTPGVTGVAGKSECPSTT